VSPEGLSEADVLGFRRRLEEMGLWASRRPDGLQADANLEQDISSTTDRERELLRMVSACLAVHMVLTGLSRFCSSPTRYP